MNTITIYSNQSACLFNSTWEIKFTKRKMSKECEWNNAFLSDEVVMYFASVPNGGARIQVKGPDFKYLFSRHVNRSHSE